MNRNIKNAEFFTIESEEEFKKILMSENVRVGKGTYSGQGRYGLLRYSQPCPRGCCHDNVNELLARHEIESEIEREYKKLNDLLVRLEEDE